MQSGISTSEEFLIKQAKSDPSHFRALYDLYFEEIFRFIVRRVGELEISKDITQQVFLKALIGLENYTYKNIPFSSYLYRIATNECNQFFRDSRKVRYVSIDAQDQSSLFTKIETEKSINEDDLTNLQEALEKLSSEELLMVELRFFEKRSFKEIGFILNISENLAKVRTYRILKKIKKVLEKES
ncbi:sigma-70 family RNA polymerase sigma factor [Algoriphagus halophytocola]|uniref:Sigma-70 family RNA polymerase sigma factor n=1 Tax=Algoriphagus halophytocola TaxID=2991499 RepID=A0ABY6MJ50_9BACT|nr:MULTISPECIES: sigma-70 family RNA polymerase sigma factor [unclassified Algoriphagus]UZD23509.1 sigma-70 family RNA polymerase sigma factor [Algoriphagus sp. TR-M5]WBL44803.1 sigma-70 family RNA polymerase sigma factor [Algoriphagus sp. TR-M9]